MKLINQSLCALVVLCLLVSCNADDVQDTQASTDLVIPVEANEDLEMVEAILDEVNNYRTSIGLSSLQLHADSEILALNHSAYMADQNRASHDNFFQRSDYLKSIHNADIVSENVAYGYQNAEEAMQAWLDSPSHRATLEKDFTHTGISVVQNENGIRYYTQLFLK